MRIQIKEDVFIITTIVLVALIAFGIGRLSAPKGEPIQIMNLEKASVEDISPYAPTEVETSEDKKTPDYQGRVLGSVASDKHHTRSQVALMKLNQ